MKKTFYPPKNRSQKRFITKDFTIVKSALLTAILFMFCEFTVTAQVIPVCNPNISPAGIITVDPANPDFGCFVETEGGCAQVNILSNDIPKGCTSPTISIAAGQGCGGGPGGSFIAYDMDCTELISVGDGMLNVILDMPAVAGVYSFILCRPGMGPINFTQLEITGCCTIEGTCNLQDQNVEGCGIGDLPAALTDPNDIFAGFISTGCGNPQLVVLEASITPNIPITVTRTYQYFDDVNMNGMFDAADELGIICSHNLIIDDTTPPNAECQDVTIQLDITGTAFLFPVNIDPTMSVDNGSNDACGLADPAFTLSQTEFGCNVEHNSLVTNNLPVTKSTNIGLRTNTNPLLFASLLNHKNLKRCQKKSNY